MDGKPEGWSEGKFGESMFGGDDVGIERWPRALAAAKLYGGRHRDFECV